MEIRRKILFLITSLEDRGAENAALRLALGMERDGSYLPEILALKEGSGRLRSRAGEKGFDRLSCLGSTSVWSFPSVVGELRAKVRREKTDVLYSFLFHPNIVSRVAGRLAGECLVINGERSIPGGPLAIRSLLRRATASLPHGYTGVSDAVRAEMVRVLGVSPEVVRTIRNGLDISAIPERGNVLASPGTVRIISIGSISPEKDYGTLVSAVQRLADRGVRVTILGEGPQRGNIQGRIDSAGLSDRFALPGHVPDVVPFLLESDIYVQSSVREGLSNALLAAMAAGLPVVATDVGGTREAVVHGESGSLVPARNPGLLAEAVRSLIRDPDRARRLGRNARARAGTEFTSERELRETISWIEELRRRHSASAVPATSRT